MNKLSKKARILLELLDEHPKDKDTLHTMLNVNVRTVRQYVDELRLRGIQVASNSHTKGYWLGSKEDIALTIADYRSRARKLYAIADALEKGEDIGQEEMDIKEEAE